MNKHSMDRTPFYLLAWFAMMCWEVYDFHPDHALVYSVILLAPIVREVTKP